MLYIHVCGGCVCIKEGDVGIIFEQNQPRCARKNMLQFFFSSNAFEEIRVKLQTLLSGSDLG